MLETYQSRVVVTTRKGGKLVVRVRHPEVALDIWSWEPIVVLRGFPVLVALEEILGCTKGV